MKSLEFIQLNDVDLDAEMSDVLDRYKALAVEGRVGENHTRIHDYLRWQVVLDRLVEVENHLDVGSGVGQLVNGMVLKYPQANVTGLDIRKNHRFQQFGDFHFLEHNLVDPLPQKYKTITCLETIEHIPDPGFDQAVENLKAATGERLIVSVPYREKQPMIADHHQWFDDDRLISLFPGAHISVAAIGRMVEWALIDWRK